MGIFISPVLSSLGRASTCTEVIRAAAQKPDAHAVQGWQARLIDIVGKDVLRAFQAHLVRARSGVLSPAAEDLLLCSLMCAVFSRSLRHLHESEEPILAGAILCYVWE